MKLKFFYINVLSALEYNPNEKYFINFMINKAILEMNVINQCKMTVNKKPLTLRKYNRLYIDIVLRYLVGYQTPGIGSILSYYLLH